MRKDWQWAISLGSPWVPPRGVKVIIEDLRKE
jgi:hypothetical protein